MAPEGWSQATIGEAADIVGGFAFPHSHQGQVGKPYPFFKVSDMNRSGNEVQLIVAENTVDHDAIRSLRAKVYPKGTIVFPKVGAALLTNKRRLLGRPGLFDNNVMGLVPTRSFGPFLFYFMQTVDFASMVQSGAVPSVNGSMVGEIGIALPPLGEQRKIAAILSSVDDAIEATQAVIDQLQVVKKAMMAELLTRGLPGRHTRFKMTEIGEIPEEWEVVRAESVFAEGPSNGRSPPSKASPPGVPTFSISAVRRGRVNIRDNVKYADGDVDGLRGALVRNGDILIVRGNGNPELVGRCGVVAEEPPDGCIYPDILMRVRPDDALLPEFFVPLWNSPLVHDQVLDKAKTTNGTYKINGQDVRSILLPIPTKHEQRLIGDAVLAAEANSLSHADQLAGLQTLKSALMSVLLTGEVRVKPDEGAR